MKKTILTFAMGCLLFGLVSFTIVHDVSTSLESRTRVSYNTAIEDNDFVMKAADGGLLEVKAAELAVKTSKNDEIKKFAELMLKDHSKANTELQLAAKKKSIETPTKLSAQSEQKLQALSSKTGIEFDRAYAAAMVADHKATVALFENEVKDGKDAEFKSWAQAKLPTLKHHLTMATEMESKVKK